MPVDLHTHSTASDGSYSPSKLARAFAANKISIAALTDHDTVGGVDEFMKTCVEVGVTGIGGIEFSAVHNGIEVHLLGYGLPMDNPRCVDFLNNHAEYLRGRCADILNKLSGYGFIISLDEVYECSNGNPPMPPHIIRALANKGHFFDLGTAIKFFIEYLHFGAKAWVDHETKLEDPLRMMNDVKAVAIVSHPVRLPNLGWLEEILDMGADGFELYYPDQNGALFNSLFLIAEKRGCVVTGGSDFHGAYAERQIGVPEIPIEIGIGLVEAIRKNAALESFPECGGAK